MTQSGSSWEHREESPVEAEERHLHLNMSDIQINAFCPEGTAQSRKKRKRKDKWLQEKMQALEKRETICREILQNEASRPVPPAPCASTQGQITPQTSSVSHLNFTVSSTVSDEKPNTNTAPGPTVSSSRCKSLSMRNPGKYVALDCEMVGTGPKGSINQLARCSIVSYEGDVVYDKFIKPSVPVTDYRTRWSGIRHRDLFKATPFTQARKEILKLIMGKVVIGHAVYNDFKVLGYSHPASLTRDTSRIPLLNKKAGFAETDCASLKRLTKAIFNRDIQTGRKGHSSVEDAKATMELYRVVEVEWERKLACNI